MEHRLSAIVRQKRMQAGLSLREFAAMIDIPASTLSDFETGKGCDPPAEVIERMEQVLRVRNGALLIQSSSAQVLISRILQNNPNAEDMLLNAAYKGQPMERIAAVL